MKKLYAFLVFALPFFAFSQSQDYSRYNNSWRLGLNIGASWQTSDVRSRAGIAGGITLEKGFLENNTNFFSLAIRGRYLAANTFGSGYSRNYGIKDNDALNGKYDATVNYVDSVPAGRRYVYDNYKMTYGEGSLELQLGFNRLRAQTHVILNLWGGVGITSFKVNTNLKDANGKMYDFSKVDTGSATQSLSSLKSMYDHSYESSAYGSKGGNIIAFAPSCGIGLGYQFSPVFSIIAEYKLTFPQGVNADLLDGKIGHNNDWIAGSKDYYHYAGINLLFTLRGKKHVKDSTRTSYVQPVYTETVVNTYTAAPTTSVVTTQPVTTLPPPVTSTPPPTSYVMEKPVVDFVNPGSSNTSVNAPQYLVTAQILNVDNASQIRLKLNAFTQSNFTFDPQTHMLQYAATLQEGINFVKIQATNVAGTDSKTVFIDYKKEQIVTQPAGNPPQVTITNPLDNPHTVTTPQFNLQADVLEVASGAGISVKVNGSALTGFSFNNVTRRLIVPVSLIEGNNMVEVSATNAFGSDSKTSTIIYQKLQVKLPPPVITIIDPAMNPYTSSSAGYVVKAQVLNVSSQTQVAVSVNGQSAAFAYDNNTKKVSISANLAAGYNAVTISANNSSGNDQKSISINYKPVRQIAMPPAIIFTQPVGSGSTGSSYFTFRATIQNIAASSQITAMYNGSQVTGFIYANGNFEYKGFLKPGPNNLVLTANNSDGSDTKGAVVVQNVIRQLTPPAVNIIQPNGNPVVAVAPYTFVFSATYVSQSQIVVKLNGTQVNAYNFNGDNGSFTANLQPGQNTLQVTATNGDGSDTKTQTVTYQPQRSVTPGEGGDVSLQKPPGIKFTNPPSSPYDGVVGEFTYKALVLNITNASQLQLNFNSSPVSNFTFNAATGEITFTTQLVGGDNTLSITATNPAGSKQKSATVKASTPVVPVQPVIETPRTPTDTTMIRGRRVRP